MENEILMGIIFASATVVVAGSLIFMSIRKKNKRNKLLENMNRPTIQPAIQPIQQSIEKLEEVKNVIGNVNKAISMMPVTVDARDTKEKNKCPICGKGALSIIECRWCGYEMGYGEESAETKQPEKVEEVKLPEKEKEIEQPKKINDFKIFIRR